MINTPYNPTITMTPISKMKMLPLYRKKNGCLYELKCRSEKAAMYSLRYTANGEKVGFEVFLIRTSPEREMGGKLIPAGECFPHNEAFGAWAWSYTTEQAALDKYTELNRIK